jgi:hypothetical protein
LERWPYDNVAAAQGVTCARLLRAATGRCVVLYASRGQYGDSLTGWDGPLWNADYRGGPGYPGDGWVAADKGAAAGWAPYSGTAPAILQYTSSATIAGLTTCDKNAFRGSLDDFRMMIGGKTMVDFSQDTMGQILAWRGDALQGGLDTVRGGPAKGEPIWLVTAVKDVQTKVDALMTPELSDAQLSALAEQVAAKLGAQLADTAAKVDQLLARLAAAGDALNG